MADLSQSTHRKPVSLNDRHYRLLQDLSAPPKQPPPPPPVTSFSLSLSLQLLFFVLILWVMVSRVSKFWIDLFGVQRKKKRAYSTWSSTDDVVFAKQNQRMIISLNSVESLILILHLVKSLIWLPYSSYLNWLTNP